MFSWGGKEFVSQYLLSLGLMDRLLLHLSVEVQPESDVVW